MTTNLKEVITSNKVTQNLKTQNKYFKNDDKFMQSLQLRYPVEDKRWKLNLDDKMVNLNWVEKNDFQFEHIDI